MKNRGFTLLELLVVIAIIAVLAALLFPVLARSKQNAKKTVCISNLHQCGVALRMYMDDYDTEIPPLESTARKLLAKEPTCCPLNTWTKNCEEFGQPFIGSYSYVRAVPGMDTASYDLLIAYFRDVAGNIPVLKMPVLMADIFHTEGKGPAPYYTWKETADQYVDRVFGSRSPDKNQDINVMIPDTVLYLCEDGHVMTHKFRTPGPEQIGKSYKPFRWSQVFSLFSGMYKE